MTSSEFTTLLSTLAAAWTRADYDTVCAAFTDDVRYGDPTRYSFNGISALRQFFDSTTSNAENCVFHSAVFDEAQQLGAAEYTYRGENQYHGLVLVRVRGDKISHWREYQHIDARLWKEFTASTT